MEHVYSSTHVCLIAAQLYVRITPICASFVFYIGPSNYRFAGMSSILFPYVVSRYVPVPPLDLYHFRVPICRRVRHAVQT